LGDIAQAKRICAECPSLTLCLEAAIERTEPWGVWGGQLFRKGKILTNKRGRGRPRKISIPEEEFPVIPIPVHLQSALRSA
jgi:WhiB family redox-sensing transcriptional regulator